MGNNLDLSSLNNLNSQEKAYVLKVLQEIQETGNSKSFEQLLYSEYKEIPVDIITFIKDPNYLGKAWHTAEGKCKLFPYWEGRLKQLFPDNVTTDYNTFIESGARGLGKSEIAVTVMLYMMHRVMCLKNPHLFYNLKVTEKFCFAFMNITKALAEDIGVSKFQETVQMSPWFMQRGTMTGRTNLIWNPPDYIDVIIGSQSSDVIGKPIFACFFDEISFIKNQDVEKQKEKALDMIDTALGGMKTRFTNRGKNPTLLVLASSKRSEKSFLEEHIKKKAETDKTGTLVVDEPVWNVRPSSEYSGERFQVALGNRFLNSEVLPLNISQVELDVWKSKGYKLISVPIEYHAKFLEDIDRALCDFAGVSSSDLTTYISGVRLMDCVDKNIKNPFTKEILVIGNNPADLQQYYDFFDMSAVPKELMSRPLYIHLDMSVSGDKTGIAGTWIVNKRNIVVQNSDTNEESLQAELYFRLAFSVAIQAPKGYQIAFEKTRQFIYWLKRQGFNIKGISSDTYQSSDMKQALLSRGYNYETISVDRVSPNEHINLPYQYFRSTIYEKRILMYPTDILTQEIVGLEKNSANGKVDHSPRGINCFTGDTLISLVSGDSIPISQLVDDVHNGIEHFVYSFNHDTQKIEPNLIVNGWVSGVANKLVVITLDNGEQIRCTPEHKFMLRDGTYRMAKNLIPNDSLMPLYTKLSNKGLNGYRLLFEPMEEEWHYEHRRFAKEVADERYLVHHKNCNKLDNSPTNLIWCSKKLHTQIHAELQTGAQSQEANLKRSESVKQSHVIAKQTIEGQLRYYHNSMVEYLEKQQKKNLENEERSNRINEINSLFNIDFISEPIENQRRYLAIYANYKNGNNVKFELSTYSSSELKKLKKDQTRTACEYFGVNYDNLTRYERQKYVIKYLNDTIPGYKEHIAQEVSKNHALGKYDKAHEALSGRIWYTNGKPGKENNIYIKDGEVIPNGFHRGRTLKNHKVMSITFVDADEPVYDIEIEHNHNFALTAGVFVHNSKDISDAVCGSIWLASMNSEEFTYDYGEDLPNIINVSGSMSQDQVLLNQVTVDFEKELNSIFDPTAKLMSSQKTNETQQFAQFYFGDGIVVW